MLNSNEACESGPNPQQVGAIGERLARIHLEAKGYRVVAANYLCRWGEVDLIARDGPVWVFVEVRTRRGNSYGSPEESVTPAKSRRLALAAEDFLGQREGLSADVHWRIDLVAIQLGPGRRVASIHHLENAVEK